MSSSRELIFDDSDDEIEAQYRAMTRAEANDSRDTTTKTELRRLYDEEGRAIENTLNDFLDPASFLQKIRAAKSGGADTAEALGSHESKAAAAASSPASASRRVRASSPASASRCDDHDKPRSKAVSSMLSKMRNPGYKPTRRRRRRVHRHKHRRRRELDVPSLLDATDDNTTSPTASRADTPPFEGAPGSANIPALAAPTHESVDHAFTQHRSTTGLLEDLVEIQRRESQWNKTLEDLIVRSHDEDLCARDRRSLFTGTDEGGAHEELLGEVAYAVGMATAGMEPGSGSDTDEANFLEVAPRSGACDDATTRRQRREGELKTLSTLLQSVRATSQLTLDALRETKAAASETEQRVLDTHKRMTLTQLSSERALADTKKIADSPTRRHTLTARHASADPEPRAFAQVMQIVENSALGNARPSRPRGATSSLRTVRRRRLRQRRRKPLPSV